MVAEHRPGDPAEMHERRREAFAPIILTLIEKRPDEQPAGIAQARKFDL